MTILANIIGGAALAAMFVVFYALGVSAGREATQQRWEVRKTQYYRGALAEIPVVAENRISLQRCIDDAIKDAILSAVHDAKDGEHR